MSEKSSNDGLENVVSGLGTAKSKREHNTFTLDLLGQHQQLEAAFIGDWLAAKIATIPAEDSCREWRRIKCADAEAISQAEKDMCLPAMVQEARTWARVYGGAGIVMLTDQDMTQPLRLNRIRTGSLKRLVVFDNVDLRPSMMNTWDPLAANYLLPEHYIIRGGSQQIHWSHIARFDGTPLPKRFLQQTLGWGDSALRRAIRGIADLMSSIGGIAELMQEANVDVIKRDGLYEDLASDMDDAIIKRYELFSQAKSIVNMALLDGNEEYQRQTLNLSGVAPIIEQFITMCSGMANIPVTRLFGTSAKGMNATGEGDESNYYDDIKSQQTSYIAPGLRTLDEVMVRSALGDWPDDFDYVWNPLKQVNALEAAQANQLTAQKHQMYLDNGVVDRSQVMRELQASEEYQFDDGQIEEAEKDDDDFNTGGGNFVESYAQMQDAGFDHDEIMERLNG